MPHFKSKKHSMMPVTKKQVDVNQTRAIETLQKKVGKLTKQPDRDQLNVIQTVTPGTAGYVAILSSCDQGLTSNARLGNEIKMLSLRMNVVITPNNLSNSDACRMIVFRYKPGVNKTLPTLANIFFATSINVGSVYNFVNRAQFQVLKDVLLDCSYGNGSKHRTFNINLKKKIATFNNTTSADFDQGHVYVLFLCADNTNKASISYNTALNYLP